MAFLVSEYDFFSFDIPIADKSIIVYVPDMMIWSQVVQTFFEEPVQIATQTASKQLFGRQFGDFVFQIIDFWFQQEKFGPENFLFRFLNGVAPQKLVVHLGREEIVLKVLHFNFNVHNLHAHTILIWKASFSIFVSIH